MIKFKSIMDKKNNLSNTLKQKNMFNKGITLIALVITIIILLILTGVTIVTLTGENGILNRANIAKEKSDEGQSKEAIILKITEYKMEALSKNETPTLEGLKEYYKNNSEIEYINLYTGTENLEPVQTGEKADRAKIKLNNYEYEYILDEKLNIIGDNKDETDIDNTTEKILYPNAEGTNDSTTPSIIGTNQIWKIANPYVGEEIYCRAEIQVDSDGDNVPDTWETTNGFIYSGGGYGVTASHVVSDTEDYISLVSGSNKVTTGSFHQGSGLDTDASSAPVRVKVFKIKKENCTVLYPNSEGTNTSSVPNIIERNQKWKIVNPYIGEDIYCRAEIQVDTDEDNTPDTWTTTEGFIYDSGGYGTTASHVISSTEDYISIVTGSSAVCTVANDSGVGGIVNKTISSAPVRVKVFKIKSGNCKILYPNAEGTSNSVTPNIIGRSQRWKIANPYAGKEIYCRAEIQLDTNGDSEPDTWTTTNGFIYTSGGYGVSALQVITNTEEYITVVTGSNAICTGSAHQGGGVDISNDVGAPVRIKVFKLE